MKRIGISYTRTNFHFYWDWFTEKDLKNSVELIELSFEKNNLKDIERCDGFVLTGGVDVDTSLYNGAVNYAEQPAFQHERDIFETKIYEYAQRKQLPLLGICRGLQLVNVLQGGKLIEDIGSANKIHKKEGGIDKMHAILVKEDSLLKEITGTASGNINSAHHQAAKPSALGKNLVVNAWSETDNIIEGLEFSDKSGKGFMMCVQWHPERMGDREANPFSKNLKQRFIREVKAIK